MDNINLLAGFLKARQKLCLEDCLIYWEDLEKCFLDQDFLGILRKQIATSAPLINHLLSFCRMTTKVEKVSIQSEGIRLRSIHTRESINYTSSSYAEALEEAGIYDGEVERSFLRLVKIISQIFLDSDTLDSVEVFVPLHKVAHDGDRARVLNFIKLYIWPWTSQTEILSDGIVVRFENGSNSSQDAYILTPEIKRDRKSLRWNFGDAVYNFEWPTKSVVIPKVKLYNHVFDVPFFVISKASCKTEEDYPTPKEIRQAIKDNLDNISNNELKEIVGAPFSTYEEEQDDY
jgi:hypothetical protein